MAPETLNFVNGVATAPTTFDVAENVILTAVSGFTTGTSSTITVGQATTTTTLVSSNNPSSYGVGLTFTATLNSVAPSAAIPNGTVTFVVDGGTPRTVPLAAGKGALTVPSLTVGKHTVNASYFGNPNFKNSTSTIIQTVNLALTPTVPDTSAGNNYSATIQASGGSGNYSYTLIGGALPKNVSLSAAGVVSGTPTVAGSYAFTVLATDLNKPGVTAVGLYSFKVAPASISALAMNAPTTATAGTGFYLTATAKDTYGNPYSGQVKLTSTDPNGVFGSSATLVNGTATWLVVLKTAGSTSLHAALGTISGAAQMTVNPAAASTLAVTAPATATAGTSFSTTVDAKDPFGNDVPSVNGIVHLYSTDSQAVSPATFTLVNGKATVGVTLDREDPLKLLATNGVIGGYSGLVTVNPEPIAALAMNAPTTITAGTGFYLTATAKDALGNPYSGQVTLTSTDPHAVFAANATLVNGTATWLVVLKTAGTTSFHAALGTITGTAQMTVNPASANILAVTAPSTATAGTGFTTSVIAEDPFGNVVPTINGVVHLYSTDSQPVNPATFTLVNGKATVGVTLNREDPLKLLATNGVIGGYSGLITVNPEPIAALAMSAPSTITAGTGFYLTATAKDALGNPYSGQVTLTSTDPNAVFGAKATLVNGTATWLVVLKTAGNTSFHAALGAITGTAQMTVNPAVASTFAVTAPTTATAGTSFTTTVVAKDPFGNDVPSLNGVVHLYSTDSQPVSPATITLVNGKATAAVTLNVADPVKLLAANGVIGGYSGLITVSPAAASQLTVTSATAVVAGNPLGVTIVGKDRFGNLVNGTVTLSSSDGEVLTPNTFTMTNGVASALVKLTRAGSLHLTATMGTASGTGASITVYPGALSSFSITAPTAVSVNSPFNVTITALDAYGNTVTGFTGGVALAASNGTAMAPSVVTLIDGRLTTAVTLKARGTFTLAATLGSLKGTSNAITVS
jgi:hypothetical protein